MLSIYCCKLWFSTSSAFAVICHPLCGLRQMFCLFSQSNQFNSIYVKSTFFLWATTILSDISDDERQDTHISICAPKLYLPLEVWGKKYSSVAEHMPCTWNIPISIPGSPSPGINFVWKPRELLPVITGNSELDRSVIWLGRGQLQMQSNKLQNYKELHTKEEFCAVQKLASLSSC